MEMCKRVISLKNNHQRGMCKLFISWAISSWCYQKQSISRLLWVWYDQTQLTLMLDSSKLELLGDNTCQLTQMGNQMLRDQECFRHTTAASCLVNIILGLRSERESQLRWIQQVNGPKCAYLIECL